MVEQAALRTMDGVSFLAEFWFGVRLDMHDQEKIADRAVESHVGTRPTSGAEGCLDVSCGTVGGAVVWLKNRLLEYGLLRAGLKGWADTYVAWNELHMPQFEIDLPPRDSAEWFRIGKSGYARSGICRSPLARLEPIDRVAERLTRFGDSQSCPYCRRYFRNGSALRLHVVESHGVTA